MRLQRVRIENFKNLQQFEIIFEENKEPTVLLGKNGTGKTNFYESVLEIFKSLDTDSLCPFDFELEYERSNHNIFISQHQRKRRAKIDGDKVSIKAITNYPMHSDKSTGKNVIETFNKIYLPRRIFTYYSGKSQRLQKFFYFFEKQYLDGLLKYDINDLSELQNKENINDSLRRFIYEHNIYCNIFLIVYLSTDNDKKIDWLTSLIGNVSLYDVKITLKKPWWSTKKSGDQKFWGARGLADEYLQYVAKHALLVEDSLDQKLYWFPNIESIKNFIAEDVGTEKDFFVRIETLYISDLIENITVTVKDNSQHLVTIESLSEGELQLIHVLGMLYFIGEDESLFLLDEPDTCLNPTWKYTYMNLLNNYCSMNGTTHIILSTHDPLIVNGLNKTQIRIFEKDADLGHSINIIPDESPIGMGIDGLLTSEFYGLNSTLDSETQRKVEEKRILYIKYRNQNITEIEKERYNQVSKELDNMIFSKTIVSDNLYDEYITALYSELDTVYKDILTKQDIEERKNISKKIMIRLLRG